jgi:3-hydroxybutyryl-CoA dehydratase
MTATFAKTITEADIILFAGASGDNNAIHINDEFARATSFGGRIAHGFLTASVISAAVANRLPGPGAIYISQQMNFRAPVRPGDTVHASVVVREVNTERARVTLENRLPGGRDGGDRRRGGGPDHLARAARQGRRSLNNQTDSPTRRTR